MMENTTKVVENVIEEAANTKSGKGAGWIALGATLLIAGVAGAVMYFTGKNKDQAEDEDVIDGRFVDEDEEVESDDDSEE